MTQTKLLAARALLTQQRLAVALGGLAGATCKVADVALDATPMVVDVDWIEAAMRKVRRADRNHAVAMAILEAAQMEDLT